MNSVSGNRFGDLFARIWRTVKESRIARLFIPPESFILDIPHESFIDRAWTESLAFGFFDWLLNLIPRVLGALYLRFRKSFDCSLLFGLLGRLSDEMGVFSGLFMFFLLIVPQKYWNNMFSLFGALALLLLFLVYAMRKQGRIKSELISPYMLAFAVFVCISFLTSYYRSLSLRFLIFNFTCMLLVPVLVSSLTDRRQLDRFVLLMLSGLAVAVLYGCYQMVVGVPVVLWQMDITVNGTMPGRVYSFFENPNAFAEVLTMLAPFSAAVLVNNKNRYIKLLSALLLLASIAVMAMTLSRAGYMAFAAEFALAVLFYNWKLVPLFAVLGILSMPFMPATISKRLVTIVTGDSSISSRSYTYNSALKLIRDFWTLGVGLGVDPAQKIVNVNSFYSNGYKFIHSHNTFIQIWVEMGLLGILSFLGTAANWFKRSSSWIIDRRCPKDMKNVILAGTAGIVGVLIFGLVDFVWFYPRIMVIFWAVIAVTVAAVKIASDEAERIIK